MYNQIKQQDSLLREAERVLDHAERNLPTSINMEREMEKFSEQDQKDIKKYVASLERVMEQDKNQGRNIRSAPRLFKSRYKKI